MVVATISTVEDTDVELESKMVDSVKLPVSVAMTLSTLVVVSVTVDCVDGFTGDVFSASVTDLVDSEIIVVDDFCVVVFASSSRISISFSVT